MKMTRNPYRWMLAMVTAFSCPYITYWLIVQGQQIGNKADELMPTVLLSHPIVLLAIDAAYQGLVFTMLAQVLLGNGRTNASDSDLANEQER